MQGQLKVGDDFHHFVRNAGGALTGALNRFVDHFGAVDLLLPAAFGDIDLGHANLE